MTKNVFARCVLVATLGQGGAAFPALSPVAHAADTCTGAPLQSATTDASVTSQRLLHALLETNGVPGMGAAVWQGGDVAWTGCAGYRDIEAQAPVQRDTVFRLASVSKVIAATAAAKLAEEGRLDLDAPVGETLDWLPPAWRAPTPRQLAAHISGAPHYIDEDVDALGHTRYAMGRDAVGYFSGRALLSDPGSTYHYSSWGYTVLGTLIEARSGQHFLDYVSQQVASGLAIDADGEGDSLRESALYVIEEGPARRVTRTDMSYTWAGGGLAATPEALVTFGGRLLEHRIVSAETWQAMLQPTLLTDGTPARERDFEVGLGWRVGRDQDGARITHHAGVTLGARSVLLLWPEQDMAVGVVSNASWVSSIEATAQVLAAPFRAPPAGLVANACPASGRLAATLKGETFEVDASFSIEDGRCVGAFEAAGPLRAHFKGANQWSGQRLRIIAMDTGGGLMRAGLATPYGLYDLRAKAPGRWAAVLGSTTLELARLDAGEGR